MARTSSGRILLMEDVTFSVIDPATVVKRLRPVVKKVTTSSWLQRPRPSALLSVIAVALPPVLPAGLPLLAALGGLGTRWNGWRKWSGPVRWRFVARSRSSRDGEAVGDQRELSAGGKR